MVYVFQLLALTAAIGCQLRHRPIVGIDRLDGRIRKPPFCD
jgi:hypothetical protein